MHLPFRGAYIRGSGNNTSIGKLFCEYIIFLPDYAGTIGGTESAG